MIVLVVHNFEKKVVSWILISLKDYFLSEVSKKFPKEPSQKEIKIFPLSFSFTKLYERNSSSLLLSLRTSFPSLFLFYFDGFVIIEKQFGGGELSINRLPFTDRMTQQNNNLIAKPTLFLSKQLYMKNIVHTKAHFTQH